MAINASLALKVQQKDDPIQHNNGIECHRVRQSEQCYRFGSGSGVVSTILHRVPSPGWSTAFWLREKTSSFGLENTGTVSVNIPYVDLFDQFASMASYRYYSASSSAKKQYTSLTSLVYLLVVSKLVKMYLQ